MANRSLSFSIPVMSFTKWFVPFLGLLLLFVAHSTALVYRVQPAVSLWFPPSGVAIAVTLWLGPVGLVLTGFSSIMMAPFWGSDGWMRFVGLTDIVEPLVAWMLYRCWFRGSLTLSGVRDVIAFLVSAPLFACMTSAVVGTSALYGLGKVSEAAFWVTMAHWWVGNAIGTMAIAPPALVFLTPLLCRWKWIRLSSNEERTDLDRYTHIPYPWLEIVPILASVVAIAFLTVQASKESIFAALQFSLLSCVPIIWAACRLGVKGGIVTASSNVLITLFTYVVVYPDAIASPQFPVVPELLHLHKLSLLLQCAIGLVVGTAITEWAVTQVDLAVEQVRLREYQASAQLSEKLFQLNRLLTEANQQLKASEDRFRISEGALRKNQELLHAVIENFPNGGVFVFDQMLRYVLAAGSGLAVVGMTRTDLEGRTIWEALSPETCRILEPEYRKALEGDSSRFEVPFANRAYDTHVLPIKSDCNEVLFGMAITQDITERKQTELALLHANERFQLAAAAVDSMIYDWQIEGDRIQRTEGLTRLLGYLPDEVEPTNRWWQHQIHPDDFPQLPVVPVATSSTADRYSLEYRVRHKQGHYVHVHDQGLILRDATGNPVRVVGNTIDVSEQKQAEIALRESEERLRLALIATNQGLFDLNLQTGEAVVSPEYAHILGYDPASFQETNSKWRDRLHPDDVETVQKAYEEYVAGQHPEYRVEFRQRAQSGEWKWILALGKIVERDEKGAPLRMLGTQADITDQKRAEAALRQSQERLNLALEAAGMGIWSWNLQTMDVYSSAKFNHLFGITPDTLRHNFESFINLIHPEDRVLVKQTIQRAIYERAECSLEFRIIKPDGTLVWVASRGRVFYNAVGTPIQMTGVSLDITERKSIEAERESILVRELAARQQAESASRMKDEFLAIVSHELRSPLNGILGWSRLLRTRTLTPEKREQALASIERNAQAQTQLIEDLLDISRIIRGTVRLYPRPVNLIPILQAALDTVRPPADTKSIHLETHFDSMIGQVSGDPDRLQQIVWNLLSNAVKFTPSGGRVTLRLEQVDKGIEGAERMSERVSETPPIHPPIHSSTSSSPIPFPAYARITVIDTGKGISPEFLPYVFERFRQADSSTTRSEGGLGLGLAIVRNLVELHGGSVYAHSAGIGQGASFTVELPILSSNNTPSDRPSQSLVSTEAQPESLAGLRVLVVDDEIDTREFLVAALEQFGATVIAAANTQEAIALLQKMHPDVLLSDIGMPEEDGYSLIQQVRKLPPEAGGQVPAAAITAYVSGDDRRRAIATGFQLHISKPIDPVQLLNVVKQLVQGQQRNN